MTSLEVVTSRCRLQVWPDGLVATLSSPAGEEWAALRPLAALDTTEGPDETLAVEPPREVAPRTFEVVRRSTRWEHAATRLVCTDDGIDVVATVRGRGRLTDVHLLAGRLLLPDRPTGFTPSGSRFRTLFSPNPVEPGPLVRSAAESAVVGVSGDGQPGRARWFFTPAPLSLWLTVADVDRPGPVDDGWVGFSVAAPVERLPFVELGYVASEGGFTVRLDYEGHTSVDGEFEAPTLVLTSGAEDPYAGLRGHRADLVARGLAPPPRERDVPEWWRRPIFCGWGAQSALARTTGAPAPVHATQAAYDGFLAELEAHGVVPGTVVIDDKWQTAYGTNEPDPAKWPDLRGWIADRHDRDQRVLLWWKAWDPEGLPAELCIRNPDGDCVAVDPTNPAAREALAASVTAMLAPGGLDADGLKIDFTARTPSGSALTSHGPGWGIALLHELLAVVYAAAKAVKPDALVMTHTPHPSFVDVTDMIRLNDMIHADSVVRQMRYRAEVARAACPELLIDTDDWPVASRAAWREYLDVKPELGVPSLYYATHFDRSGEALREDDYEALRRVFASTGVAVENKKPHR